MYWKVTKRQVALLIAATCAVTAGATEFEFNYDKSQKYYNAAENYRDYYLEYTSQGPGWFGTTIAHATLDDDIGGVKPANLCFRAYALDSGPGLFRAKGSINVYYLNLSSIAKVESQGARGPSRDPFYTEIVTLRDGTKLETVLFSEYKQILACGLNNAGEMKVKEQRWESYDSHNQGASCNYDESKIDRSKWPNVDISSVFAYSRPRKDAKIYLGFNPMGKGFTETLDVEQGRLSEKFSQCSAGSARFVALEKAREADLAAAWDARRKQQDLERQEAVRRQEQVQAELAAEAANMRSTIAVGTKTNCGLVFDIKKPMIGVQTMIGMQYLHIDQLWGPSAGCYFKNGVYVGPNR